MKERVPLVVVSTPRPGHSVSNTRRSLRGGSTRKDETKRSVSLGIRGPHADLADPYLLGGTWRRLAATTSKFAAIVKRYDALKGNHGALWRASASYYESGGQEFESLRARQSPIALLMSTRLGDRGASWRMVGRRPVFGPSQSRGLTKKGPRQGCRPWSPAQGSDKRSRGRRRYNSQRGRTIAWIDCVPRLECYRRTSTTRLFVRSITTTMAPSTIRISYRRFGKPSSSILTDDGT